MVFYEYKVKTLQRPDRLSMGVKEAVDEKTASK